MKQKKCRVCNELKIESFFYSTYNYIRNICKKCEDKKACERTKENGRTNKLKAVDYLGGKCMRCGYNKCLQALEFNHIKDKEHEPTVLFRRVKDWERIKKELDKCELLCANCHREYTFKDK